MVYRFTFEARLVLRNYRKKRNLTLDDVASKLGVTKSYISQIELGYKNIPRYRILIAWLEVLKIKPKYFEELCSNIKV